MNHKQIIQFLSGPEKENPLYFLAVVATDLMLMPSISSVAMVPSQMKEHLCLLCEINNYNLISTRPILLDALYMIIKSTDTEGSILHARDVLEKAPKSFVCLFHPAHLFTLSLARFSKTLH
jgi:hypothetical protein